MSDEMKTETEEMHYPYVVRGGNYVLFLWNTYKKIGYAGISWLVYTR